MTLHQSQTTPTGIVACLSSLCRPQETSDRQALRHFAGKLLPIMERARAGCVGAEVAAQWLVRERAKVTAS